jgi:hypothetical protein
VDIHKSTVGRILSKMDEHPDPYYKAPRGHQKRKLDERDMHQAERMINLGLARNGADVQHTLFPQVSDATVCWRLNEYGPEGHVQAEKPYLNARHMWGRRELVEEFAGWEEKDWDAVVFSDESKFNLFGSDGKKYCCRRKGDCYKERNVKKTVKHGGRSLMVWGCITRWGTGQLIRVVVNMDRFQFIKILKQGILGTLHDYDMDLDGIYFQQDGDSKHTSQHAMEFFKSQGINLLSCSVMIYFALPHQIGSKFLVLLQEI